MNGSEIISALFLFWPLPVGIILVFCIVGILFALSVGGFLVGFILASYYIILYLKKKGFFRWMQKTVSNTTIQISETLQKNIRETFQVKGDVSGLPEGPLLLLAHPHGLFSMAPFFHWSACLTSWSKERRVRIAVHSIFFRIPILREVMEAYGAIEATEEEIQSVLESGDSVALLTGGIQELQETSPGKMRIVLKKRRGFLRIAKELGVPLVPVLTFGENELFPPLRSYFWEKVQTYLKLWFGVAIPLPTFQSLRHWLELLNGPLQTPVETWIGRPILTDKKKSLEALKEQVLEEMNRLYKEGKPKHYADAIEFL